MLEACIEMGLKAEFANDGVVVAVYMGVDAIHALEYLPDHAGKRLGKRNTCNSQKELISRPNTHANPAREHGLIVNVALDPSHQMLDVCWCRHFGRSFVVV